MEEKKISKGLIWATTKIYWQYCLKYKLAFSAMVIFCVAEALILPTVPLYYKKFFDTFALKNGDIAATLFSLLIIIALLNAAARLMAFLMIKGMTVLENNVMVELFSLCFKTVHQHSYGYFNDNFSGSFVKKINYFTRSFEVIVDNIFFNLLPNSVSMIFIISVLWLKNSYLGLGVLVWFVVFIIINWQVVKYRMKFDAARNEAESEVTADLSDTISNHNNVRLFNGFKYEVAKFKELNEKAKKLRLRSWNIHANFDGGVMAFSLILEIGLMYFGIKFWQLGKITIGDFVLLQTYALMVMERTNWLGNILRRTFQSFSDAGEMTEILNKPIEITDVPRALPLKINKGEISFANVDFYYNQTRQVLNKFNLQIKPGEKLALIGKSGAGKTTIINLLLRNFDVSSGHIFIDKQDIALVTKESLRQTISLVPQDPILFHRSIGENIAYGKIGASKKEVIKAAKLANCHEFITDLSKAYETMVGERGVKLSGGERQRVAIARAILRNTPVLILDEATSSLDSASEELIQTALNNLMKEKTVIVIAHRLSTIKKMDRIACLDETGIVEMGRHEELIEKESGLYRGLWEKQSGGFLAGDDANLVK